MNQEGGATSLKKRLQMSIQHPFPSSSSTPNRDEKRASDIILPLLIVFELFLERSSSHFLSSFFFKDISQKRSYFLFDISFRWQKCSLLSIFNKV